MNQHDKDLYKRIAVEVTLGIIALLIIVSVRGM